MKTEFNWGLFPSYSLINLILDSEEQCVLSFEVRYSVPAAMPISVRARGCHWVSAESRNGGIPPRKGLTTEGVTERAESS